MITKDINFLELRYSQDTTLREYQVVNKRKIYEAWHEGKRSIMLQMPTGTGKTRLFVSIVKDFHLWGASNKRAVKVLLLAHRKELIDQISENVSKKYGLAHGLIVSNGLEERRFPVQVGSVPTLSRRLERWSNKEFDIIIIDEAHHVKAESYKKIIDQYPEARILGVTATPYRLSGAGFHPEFDCLIQSQPVEQFIEEGYLSNYEYYSIKPDSRLQMEIDNIAIGFDGDYSEAGLSDCLDKDRIRAKIVDTYMQFAKGKKGLVYTINRAHNENVCQAFIERGVKAVAIDGMTPKELRDKLVEDFREGRVDVMCNVNIFSEGFDCPDAEFVQLARPTKSLSMYLQQVGRALRPAEGKSAALILDNVGLFNRFGFPSASRNWQRHFDGSKESEEEKIKAKHETSPSPRLRIIEEGDEVMALVHASGHNHVAPRYTFEDYLSIPINCVARSQDLDHIELTWRGIFGKVYRKEMKEYFVKIQDALFSARISGDSQRYNMLAQIKLNYERGLGYVKSQKMPDGEVLEAINALYDSGLRVYMINVEFIIEMLKDTDYVNKDGKLCERKKVKNEKAYVYTPITKWTDNKFGSLLDKAIKKL